MIDTSRMTDRVRKILRIAEEQARRRGAISVLPEHVLLGCSMEKVGVAGHVLRQLGATSKAIASQLTQTNSNSDDSTQPLTWDSGVLRAIERSHQEMIPLGHNYMGTEHLVLGIVLSEEDNAVPAILNRLNISPASVKTNVYNLLGHGD